MKKNTKKIMAWLALGAIMLVGCSNNKTNTNSENVVSTEVNAGAQTTNSATNEKLGDSDDYNTSTDGTVIEMSGNGATINGSGASSESGKINITSAGTYILRGEFNGEISINAGDRDVVHLVLDNAKITNTLGSAINAGSGKKVVITVIEATVTDGSQYNYSDGNEDADAAIFVKNDLTINGSGNLTVNSNYENAIKAKDNLLIVDSNINIISTGKAIKGSDGVSIEGGKITINAEDDGITTDGSIVINGGSINIEKSGEGLEAVAVEINGGDISIVSTDDGINARGVLEDGATDEEKEAYGMKNQPDTYVRVTGGVVFVNSTADGIDSNGQIYIDGGSVTIAGPTSDGDGTIDYNGEAVITGGTFIALGSSGMYQSFGESSTQNYINIGLTGKQAKGTKLEVLDESGNTIISTTSSKEFSAAIVSSDKLVTGSTYKVVVGDTTNEVTITAGKNTVGQINGGFGGQPMPQMETDANGKPVMPEMETDANGKPVMPEMETDANGKPVMPEMETDANGKPVMPEMETDANGKPVMPQMKPHDGQGPRDNAAVSSGESL